MRLPCGWPCGPTFRSYQVTQDSFSWISKRLLKEGAVSFCAPLSHGVASWTGLHQCDRHEKYAPGPLSIHPAASRSEGADRLEVDSNDTGTASIEQIEDEVKVVLFCKFLWSGCLSSAPQPKRVRRAVHKVEISLLEALEAG